MSSRDNILKAIRQQPVAAAPLPELPAGGIVYDDREKQFSEVLAAVGGEAIVVTSPVALPGRLRELPCLRGASRVICEVPGLDLGTERLADVARPTDLASVDVAILPGQFAVAENAAVWVSSEQLAHRVIYFIPQHLVLVVPRHEIVHTLHEAYARLAFPSQGYGLFMSGPSKTADIEQSLVIGAHGPRSLTVILLEDAR